MTADEIRIVPAVANRSAPTVAELEAGTAVRGITLTPAMAEIGAVFSGCSVDTYRARVARTLEEFEADGTHNDPGLFARFRDTPRRWAMGVESGEVPPPSRRSPEEFVEYADDVLEAAGFDPMYPKPHEHTGEPWPFGSF